MVCLPVPMTLRAAVQQLFRGADRRGFGFGANSVPQVLAAGRALGLPGGVAMALPGRLPTTPHAVWPPGDARGLRRGQGRAAVLPTPLTSLAKSPFPGWFAAPNGIGVTGGSSSHSLAKLRKQSEPCS